MLRIGFLLQFLFDLPQPLLQRFALRRRQRGRRLGQRSRRRGQMKIEIAGQRRVVPRHLLAVGHAEHLLAHVDHDGGEVAPGRLDALGQRRRERRIASRAVERHVAGLRRVGDEGADPRLHLRQAAADAGRARAHRARQVAPQRIVAAGVEEHDVGLGFALQLHLLEHEIQRHRLEIEIALVLQLRIDRHQVVAPAHLQAMPGVEEDAGVGDRQRAGEVAHLQVECPLVQVEPEQHLDADFLQRGRHVGGIVGRIGERARVRIGRIADDQGDAFLRGGGLHQHQRGGEASAEIDGGGRHAECDGRRPAIAHHD